MKTRIETARTRPLGEGGEHAAPPLPGGAGPVSTPGRWGRRRADVRRLHRTFFLIIYIMNKELPNLPLPLAQI